MSEADAVGDDQRPGEPVRRGEGAEGFPHGSKYPLFVGAGMFFTALGLLWLPVLVVGVPVLLYGIAGWILEYTVEEFERGVVPEQKRQLLGTETGMLAAYIVVAGEILVFLAVFVSWFYLRAENGSAFPPTADLPAPNLMIGAIMTGIMLVGSLVIAAGRRAITGGNRNRFVWSYALTFLLGIAFLGALAVEWTALMDAGLDWTTGPYGATYFLLTGLHAAHLIAGLAMLGIVLARALVRGHFSEQRNLMPRTTEVYWHFLTVVSILILVFVYLPIT